MPTAAELTVKLLRAGRYPEGADYLCIDINYFPGFEKLPGYEDMMADFLASLFTSSVPERQLYRVVSCRNPSSRASSRSLGQVEA